MKKNLFFTFTLCMGLLILSSCKPKATYPVVVENPQTVFSNTSMITFEKVELTDSVTTLYVRATQRAHNWIRIDSLAHLVANGITYPVTGSDGIELDKEFWMPDSGVAYFTLKFAPLPAATGSFDFIEGEPEDFFKIFGISLVGEIENPLPKVKYDKNEELIPSVVSSEKAIVKGQFFGYNPAMGNSMLSYQYMPFGKNEYTEDKFPVDENGKFQIELTPYFPVQIFSQFGAFFVIPGKTTELYVDLATRNTEYKGTLSTLNKEFGKFQDVVKVNSLIEIVLDEINGKSESEAIACLNNHFTVLLDTIRALNLCKATDYLANMIVKVYYTDIRSRLPQYCPIWAQQVARDTTRAPYQAPVFTEALKSENMLTFNDFTETPYFSYLGYDSQNPLAVEAVKVKEILTKIESGFKPTEEDLKEYEQFSSPAYKEIILARLAEIEKMLADFEKMENVHYMTINDVPNDKLIAKLLEPYKGKPVLVDIWATWCGPCKAAMKTIHPVKDALKDKVTFLYVTGESSPKSTWMKMIPDISGEHYYLTKEQYSYILDKYESQGIPTYLLFDGEGKFAHKHIGYPGNETIQSELEGLIK